MNGYLSILKERLRFGKAFNNRIILLHGSLAHVFEKEGSFCQIPSERLVREMSGLAPARLLLASPYIRSFVHETIHLSGKELERAGRYKLPFSRTVGERETVSSIALNQKRALTVHSRLSPKGAELLDSLRKSGVRAYWRPAVLTFIQNLLSFSSSAFPQEKHLRIYLQEETLQICPGSPPDFQNYYYWRPELNFEQKKRFMDKLLNEDQTEETPIEIVFDNLEEAPAEQILFIHSLLYPKGNKSKLKVRQRTLKEKSKNDRKAITLNRALAVSCLALAVWAAVLHFQLFEAKSKYIERQKYLATLRKLSENLKRTAKTERTYFELSSFWETVDRLGIKPDAILKQLENILPPGIWIYRISINLDKIALVLLDNNKERELSELIELLDLNLGKTSLEANETAAFENLSLKKYRLIITRSDTNNVNEKMDKE